MSISESNLVKFEDLTVLEINICLAAIDNWTNAEKSLENALRERIVSTLPEDTAEEFDKVLAEEIETVYKLKQDDIKRVKDTLSSLLAEKTLKEVELLISGAF